MAKKAFGKYKCPFEVYRTTETWDLSSIIKPKGAPLLQSMFAARMHSDCIIPVKVRGGYPKPALIPPHRLQFIVQSQCVLRCVTPVVEDAANHNVVNVIIMTRREF